MGLGICGYEPTTKRGEYFYVNSAAWTSVAAYCEVVAPDFFAGNENSWFHGYCGGPEGPFGLDAAGAIALAEVLEAEITASKTAVFLGECGFSEDVIEGAVRLYQSFAVFSRESGGFSIW